MTGDPLVTVAMPVYRHKPYLEAAVQSVLAQDYSPLQIVISDDASPDDAFDFVRRIVADYRGPHRVVLNRNEQNMSMGNYDKLMEMAEGRFIVVAHDDDIAMPHRVRRLTEFWRTVRASMLTSNARIIAADGTELGLARPLSSDQCVGLHRIAAEGWNNRLLGGTLSWDREVFDAFGSLNIDGTARTSDWILPFRAALLKGIYYIDEPLLAIRKHDSNRGKIGRSATDTDIDNVEISSENLTQLVYMLDTLRAFRRRHPLRALKTVGVHWLILREIERRARVLGRHRNRLHMRRKKMAWVDHGDP
jgi:glycosyltransferase involved in cell wall biosynthesis